MLKNLKKLQGTVEISKKEQQAISGGFTPAYYQCLRTCAGSCTYTGRCFQMEK